MKQAVGFVLALALVAPRAGYGQQVPVIIEAESGTVGSEFTPGVDGTVNFIGVATTSDPEPGVAGFVVPAGGVTVNSRGMLAGHVLAPAGTVTIDAWTFGSIAADRLIVNTSGRLLAGQ